jgi:hypothetical protein
MTGLPANFVQVAPPSRLTAMFWVCLLRFRAGELPV